MYEIGELLLDLIPRRRTECSRLLRFGQLVLRGFLQTCSVNCFAVNNSLGKRILCFAQKVTRLLRRLVIDKLYSCSVLQRYLQAMSIYVALNNMFQFQKCSHYYVFFRLFFPIFYLRSCRETADCIREIFPRVTRDHVEQILLANRGTSVQRLI